MKKLNIIKKPALLGCFLLCTACLPATGCSAIQETEGSENDILIIDRAEEEFSYNTTTISVEDVIRTARVSCIYRRADESAIYISGIGKTVEEVYVKRGDDVTEGQLLARLSGGDREKDIRDLEYKIARNQLLLDCTEEDEVYELSYRWWTYLYRTSMSEYDTKQLEQDLEAIHKRYRYLREDYQDAIDLDTRQLEFYQQEMKEGLIYADRSGQVSFIEPYIKGSVLTEERLLLKLNDTSQCFFTSTQTNYAECFHEGQAVQLSFSSNGSTIYLGVTPIDMENWDDRMTFEVTSGDASEVAAGKLGYIYVVEDARMQVLAAPNNCLHQSQDGEYYVYVLNSNNVREAKWVKIGLRGDVMTEIIEGLTEGEEILLQ